MTLISKTQNTITVKIVTKDGAPASNVNIELKKLKKFTISDADGLFTISNISNGTYHIIVSFTGLITQQQQVTVQQNETT